MALKTTAGSEVTLNLNTPAELFLVSPAGLLSHGGRLQNGMDELVQELTPRWLSTGLRATIVLPNDQFSPGIEGPVRGAIGRYCQLRLRQTELVRQAQWQDVIAAFRVGVVIFGLALLISYYFSVSGLATLTKDLLGDGFFQVVAWVGLWYPLDALVHYRRQSAREEKVLAFIGSMDIAVRPAP